MARKYPEKYSKYLVIDAALITTFTAVIVIFLWSIVDAVDFFNPIDDYIDNFDYSDIVYSEMSHKDDIYKTDTNIYIVNIGHLNRGELAQMINKIQEFEPKVIGIDAVFKDTKCSKIAEEDIDSLKTLEQEIANYNNLLFFRPDNEELQNKLDDAKQKFEGILRNNNIESYEEIKDDIALKEALNAKQNIVMGAFGQYDSINDKAIGIEKTNSYFGDFPVGHLEFSRNNGRIYREFDKFIRYFDKNNDTITINSFSAEIVRRYDNDLFLKFAKRNNKQEETINFRGGSMPFIKIDYEDVIDSCNVSMLSKLKGKIVLLGYLGMYKRAPMDSEDAFYTPLQRCEGFDAKGIEIHAHIISMIMNDDCLITLEPWQNRLIAFIITFFFVLWLVYWYVFGAKFFDILSKPIQFILVGVVLIISYYMFKKFGIKIDMMPTGIMLIFCIEVLYLYEETLELFKIDSFITQTFKYTKDERNKVLRSIVRFEFIRNKFKRSNK